MYDFILDVNVLFLESVKCGLEGMEITVMTSLRFSGEITAKPNSTGCTFQEAYSHNITTRRLYKLIVPLSLQPTNPCYKAINRTVTVSRCTPLIRKLTYAV